MKRYAANTRVSTDRTRGEIETLLRKFGAEGFAYAWQDARARIEFVMRGRHLRFELPLPPRSDFSLTPGGRRTLAPAAHWRHGIRHRVPCERGCARQPNRRAEHHPAFV